MENSGLLDGVKCTQKRLYAMPEDVFHEEFHKVTHVTGLSLQRRPQTSPLDYATVQ